MLVPLEKPDFSKRFANDPRLRGLENWLSTVRLTYATVREVLPSWQRLSNRFLKDAVFYDATDTRDSNAAKAFGRKLQDVAQTANNALKWLERSVSNLKNGKEPEAETSQVFQAFDKMSALVDADKVRDALHDYSVALEDDGDYDRGYLRELHNLEKEIDELNKYRNVYWDFKDTFH